MISKEKWCYDAYAKSAETTFIFSITREKLQTIGKRDEVLMKKMVENQINLFMTGAP